MAVRRGSKAVMDDLDEWVAEKQVELDALLRDRPDLYVAAWLRFKQELEIVWQKDAEIARLRQQVKALGNGVCMRIVDAIQTTDSDGEPLTMLAVEIDEQH